MKPSDYRLLTQFRNLFDGREYRHRSSNQGDKVLRYLYEDLRRLNKSKTLSSRIDEKMSVINIKNKRTGIASRRGDGSFGELVPVAIAVSEEGFLVSCGEIASIEIGAEAKIIAKAMIKQIDRVMSDLARQVEEFKRAGNPICVGIVAVNFAPVYSSFEGSRIETTTGKGGYKHPIQEAEQAIHRLEARSRSVFDEFLLLKFSATNQPPYEFKWVNETETLLLYSAMLTRISSLYESRFG
jgi:hypothetical protein